MENEDKDLVLVQKVARNLAATSLVCQRAFGRNIEEYLGEGFLALTLAKKNFKPELGIKFETYAYAVISERIKTAARKSSLIKLPSDARYKASLFLQGKLDNSDGKIKDAVRIMAGIADITSWDIEEKLPDKEIIEEINVRLDKLDERTRKVLVMRFGLNGEDPKTLEEISQKIDLSRESVRQIEKKGLKVLKNLIGN